MFRYILASLVLVAALAAPAVAHPPGTVGGGGHVGHRHGYHHGPVGGGLSLLGRLFAPRPALAIVPAPIAVPQFQQVVVEEQIPLSQQQVIVEEQQQLSAVEEVPPPQPVPLQAPPQQYTTRRYITTVPSAPSYRTYSYGYGAYPYSYGAAYGAGYYGYAAPLYGVAPVYYGYPYRGFRRGHHHHHGSGLGFGLGF